MEGKRKVRGIATYYEIKFTKGIMYMTEKTLGFADFFISASSSHRRQRWFAR
jgi:hypothetical protein